MKPTPRPKALAKSPNELVEELLGLQRKIDAAKNERSRLEGRKDGVEEQLQEILGTSSIETSPKILKTEIARLSQVAEKKIHELKEVLG